MMRRTRKSAPTALTVRIDALDGWVYRYYWSLVDDCLRLDEGVTVTLAGAIRAGDRAATREMRHRRRQDDTQRRLHERLEWGATDG